MIDELKQLLTMIQDVPDMVLHVLLGFAIYKIIIFLGTSAGIYGTIRLGINKWHDYKIKNMEAKIKNMEAANRPAPIEYKIKDKFISGPAIERFEDLILRLRHRRKHKEKGAKVYDYVFDDDVQFLIDAYNEKIEREYTPEKA